MKEYKVKIEYWHESFGGRDHRDGEEVFSVSAMNDSSATNKAMRLADKKAPTYFKKVVSVSLITLMIFVSFLIMGCGVTTATQQEAAAKSFTNMVAVAKATTMNNQFIVKGDDGSVWEVQVSEFGNGVVYKNCLFDGNR